MKKICFILPALLFSTILFAELHPDSKIISVKLFQNQAEVTREVVLDLESGTNVIVVEKLPPSLYEWSVRAQLAKEGGTQIVSVETINKPLVTRRQKNIEEIENKIAELREVDFEYADSVKNIQSQLAFLDTLGEYTKEGAQRELAGGSVQPRNWEAALEFTARKRGELQREQRSTEKKREALGKEIQKWEYELARVAGDSYVQYYNSLNELAYSNRKSVEVQQFSKMNVQYAERQRLITAPRPGIDYEKNVNVVIFSPEKSRARMTLRYMIPGTWWGMVYDLRADNGGRKIALSVQAQITQKTGEDWNNVSLELSTGAPSNTISLPQFYPWYLDVIQVYPSSATGSAMYDRMQEQDAPMEAKAEAPAPAPPQAQIKKSGLFINVALPAQISVASGETQKKSIREFMLEGRQLYYEAFPDLSSVVYLRTEVQNSTSLPWLAGESQIFYEGEYNGKMTLSETLPGASADIVLGTAQDMSVKKVLIKKYDDTSGMFGSKKRRKFDYRLTVQNNSAEARILQLYDRIPVSLNKKIIVELANVTREFDQKRETDAEQYEQGRRSWRIPLQGGQKAELGYTVVVTWEGDIAVTGLE